MSIKVMGLLGMALMQVLAAEGYAQPSAPKTEGDIGVGPTLGIYGVNRRVKTVVGLPWKPWVYAVTTFSEPQKLYIPHGNRYSSKPQLYLGSSCQSGEVDAGAQYESERIVGLMDPGWAFVTNHSNSLNVEVYTYFGNAAGHIYTVPRFKLHQFTLTYKVRPGGTEELDVSGAGGKLSSFVLHWQDMAAGAKYHTTVNSGYTSTPVFGVGASGIITPSELGSLQLKRVVAVGQIPAGKGDKYLGGAGLVYDGTYMEGEKVSNCRLSYPLRAEPNWRGTANGREFLYALPPLNWIGSFVEVGKDPKNKRPTTGFSPMVKDGTGAKWTVDMPTLPGYKSDKTGLYRLRWSPTSSRYASEVINISLRGSKHTKGHHLRHIP